MRKKMSWEITMFNKKATTIMIEFLVTVVLAILIFTPVCLATSKLLKLSDQARDSFTDFAGEIKKFAGENVKIGDKKLVLLIMDEESGIIPFNDEEPVLVFTKYTAPDFLLIGEKERATLIETNYYVSYQRQTCKGVPCVCLCREFAEGTVEETRYVPLKDLFGIKDFQRLYQLPPGRNQYLSEMAVIRSTVECKLLRCEALRLPLEMSSMYRFPSEERRIPLTLERTGNSISVTEQ